MLFIILTIQGKYRSHSMKNGIICPVVGGSIVFCFYISADASISCAFRIRYRDKSIFVMSGTHSHSLTDNITVERENIQVCAKIISVLHNRGYHNAVFQ